MRHNEKVVFIAGAGHSGSTLLGLILGSHSAVFYGGELSKTKYLNRPGAPLRKRVCKLCGEGCPIWGDFELSDGIDLYEQLSERVGRVVIVDSAKDVARLRAQIVAVVAGGGRPYLLFLHRDGRGVVNSRMRKYPERERAELIDEWRAKIEATQALFVEMNIAKRMVSYERLATAPAEEVRALSEFLELPYEEEMLAYYDHEHHVLGGNTGTQSLVARGQALAEPFVQLTERNAYYYENHPLAIRLDERWRMELDDEALALFNERAGEINRELGYED
ncbi:MAG TPA: sulfotransferase [Anaerolineae bacterium]|nr:sulfotransferase [Anaerolineae bacterium]